MDSERTEPAAAERTTAPEGAALRPGEAWVQLLPAGQATARDGRVFRVGDPEAVVRASGGHADLPVDYEHEMDDPTKARPGPVPAAGWITELEVREAGVFGRVRWTDRAAGLVEAREYRYLSPVVMRRPDGEVLRIIGASLVHRPALAMMALSAEQGPELRRIAEAAGLPADAGADAIVAFCREAASDPTPDPARFVPMEAVQELLRERAATADRLGGMEAEARVERAAEAGHLTPAMRPWAVTLCRQDPAAFEGFLAASPAPFAHLRGAMDHRFAAAPDPREREPASDAEIAICRQLGLERIET